MNDNILNVPYLTQPTPITCQSTCLKMFGMYLAGLYYMSSPVQGISILDIWKDINEGAGRPSHDRNSYQNMAWWLHKYFPNLNFTVKTSRHVDEAVSYIVNSIDNGFPVMVSTNHSRTDGHIILVVGYKDYYSGQISNAKLVCHDPYGKFNPEVLSTQYGVTGQKRGLEGGYSLINGGEVGPGKAVVYSHEGIRRIRTDKHSSGTFFLITVSV